MYQIFRKTEATADRSSAMESRDHSKNAASPKSQTSRGNIIISTGFFLLMFFFLLAGCSKPTPIDVSDDNLEEYVSIGVSKHLNGAVILDAITQYQRAPICTSTESFEEIAQKNLADGATLHPNLTYKIKFVGGKIFKIVKDKEYEAMAYSVVKNGKLYGSGVILLEAVEYAWIKTWVIGDDQYNHKGTSVNWPVVISIILLVLMGPSLIRLLGGFLRLLFGGFLHLIQPKNKNRCPRCGNICPPHYRRRTGDGGAFWHCLKCHKIWEE